MPAVLLTIKARTRSCNLYHSASIAKRRGFTITAEYVDNGISGTKDHRPQLDRLMDSARKRQIDLIVVWKLDRFGRSLKQLCRGAMGDHVAQDYRKKSALPVKVLNSAVKSFLLNQASIYCCSKQEK